MPLPKLAFINGEFVPLNSFDALFSTDDAVGGGVPPANTGSFALEGSKWGPSQTLGTTGEVVTWSFIPEGTAIDSAIAGDIHDAFGTSPGVVTTASSFLAAGFEDVIRAAFTAWESAADIRFVQVADDGRSVGSGALADIRIGGISVDGPGNTLAFTYFPGQGAISGEMFLDIGDAGLFYDGSQLDPWKALYLTALHEIGHAIGLDHDENDSDAAIMDPVLNLDLTGLQPDDIEGAQAIYGWRPGDGSTHYYDMPADETSLTTLYMDTSGIVINGTDADDHIVADMAQLGSLSLAGGKGNDFLDGRHGALTLDGGPGADTMLGGNGSTTYVVDSPDDVVIDSGTGVGDADLVDASISYTIPDTVEAVSLTGSDNLNVTGDARPNHLLGNAGDNILDGRGGGDYLAGGAGNDTYYIRDFSDTVVELGDSGIDTVYTPFSFSMTGSIENVVLLGSNNAGVSGNYANNLIVGNSGNNSLSGGDGDDTISSGAGADTINTGAGQDVVIFNAGDGRDLLGDFTKGSDVIQVNIDGYSTFDAVMSVAASSSTNTIFTFNANDVLTVWGVARADFTAADFSFGGGLPPLPSPPPSSGPMITTIGSGPDALALAISEDAWNGDAQFTVSVDGVQIGGVLTAQSPHGFGQSDTINVLGDWAPGDHSLTVSFLNDAWGGTADTDRNLYIDGVTYDDNGSAAPVTVAGGTGTLLSAGDFAVQFHDAGAGTPPPPPPPLTGGTTTIGSGSDALTIRISEDAWNGDAEYTVSVDGVQIGGTLTAHALHGSGQSDVITVLGNWAIGHHALGVTFVNDAWGGTAATDRNLYVDGVTYNDGTNPVTVSDGTGTLMSDGTLIVGFEDGGVASPPPPSPLAPGTMTLGTGPDLLVIRVSEDAWNGDAQYSIDIDGVSLGGPFTTHAIHSLGEFDTISVYADLAPGTHTVKINFLNDAWGGTPDTDRNLWVDGVTYDDDGSGGPVAVSFAGRLSTSSGFTFSFQDNGSATPSPTPPPSGSGASTIVLHVSEDAWDGDAQFQVLIDGVQQGSAQTVTASHAAGQVQDVILTGDFGAQGPSTVAIQFINDAWGGSLATDRNLYVQSIDVNGVHFQGNAAVNDAANGGEVTDPMAAVMDINGTATFQIDHSAPPMIV